MESAATDGSAPATQRFSHPTLAFRSFDFVDVKHKNTKDSIAGVSPRLLTRFYSFVRPGTPRVFTATLGRAWTTLASGDYVGIRKNRG